MATRTFFTLEYQPATTATTAVPGTEKSLADWGLAAVSASYASLKPSSFRFRQGVLDPSGTPLFPYLGWVVLRVNRTRGGSPGAYTYTGGTVVFRGYRVTCAIEVGVNSAGLIYEFQDPWFLMSQAIYKQPARTIVWTNGVAGIGTAYTSEVSLFVLPVPLQYGLKNTTTLINTGQS